MSKLLSLNNSVWFYKVVILIGAIILGERVTKITIIRNERKVISSDPMGIKRRIQTYYEQLYDHKFGNLNLINFDLFLEMHKLPKLKLFIN